MPPPDVFEFFIPRVLQTIILYRSTSDIESIYIIYRWFKFVLLIKAKTF